MSELKAGTKLELENNAGTIEIIKKLGEGGQGTVYRVNYLGQEKALKWYKKNVFTDIESFRKNLMNNIREGAPTENFLWPIALTKFHDGTFGYIMDLRPQGYHEFTDFLNRRTEFVSIDTMLKAAIHIVDSFRMLHNKGFSYQDLNDGNFFIDPKSGNVFICDNDNVSQFGDNSGIAGKCRYMAPSVVVGRKQPDKRTDQFSLAVVLFMLLLRNHPLEGEKVQSKAVLTEQRQKKYFGESPVFIADPNDPSNRPVKGVHNNFINRWPQIPEYIQSAFTKAFSKEVMCSDKIGITEKEWLQLLLRFRSEVNICPNCGRETRYYKDNMSCICCKKPIQHFGWILTPYYKIPLFPKKEIVEGYITDSYDNGESSNVIGVVSFNKTHTKVALQNKDSESWRIGSESVQPEGRILLAKGLKFRLKKEEIEIV